MPVLPLFGRNSCEDGLRGAGVAHDTFVLLDKLVDDWVDHENADKMGAGDLSQTHQEVAMPLGGEGAEVQKPATTEDLSLRRQLIKMAVGWIVGWMLLFFIIP